MKPVVYAYAVVLFVASMIVSGREVIPKDHTAVKFALETSTAAITCYKTGERISGTNKICYYDCAGSEATTTVGSHELCPLSIRR